MIECTLIILKMAGILLGSDFKDDHRQQYPLPKYKRRGISVAIHLDGGFAPLSNKDS